MLRSARLADGAYWREQIRCQAACPVHTDARGYVRAIADGDFERAYRIARGPNPLASICGRVCGAPCEQSCRRGDYDRPVSIRALKRFVCEKFGPEGRPEGGRGLHDYLAAAAVQFGDRHCQDREELLPMLQALAAGDVPKVSGKSVGIIGSGPAGLAAAHDLAILGFDVTVYELESFLGGMLMVGIPEYRLPRRVVQAEVEVITSLGVKGVTGCTVGKDVSLPELRERHDAVVIAVGMKRSRRAPCPGSDAEGVLGGVEFLRDVSLGKAPALGSRIVVIGGGNVAYDVGRTVVRQTSIDAARTARRSSGVTQVHLCSLESLEEMPADDVEIMEGDEEGIQRRNSLGPKEILKDPSGRARAVLFQKCTRVFDENRRFSPLFDETELTEIPCDTVLIAIGQTFDLSFVDAARDGLQLRPNGTIVCDPETGRTSARDLYVAGDLAYGPKLLIHAVASGKAVARAIYTQVTDRVIGHDALELHFPVPRYGREEGYEKTPRVELPATPPEERLHDMAALVERSLAQELAVREAARCLDCGVNTIFDGEKCVLCGGCVDVCPEKCLRLTPLAELSAGLEADAALRDPALAGATAILKDETCCIRCSLCANRCPADVITMERFLYRESPRCQED
ncbi:MAG: FAD-dependent oxidoreductase [Candidatus Wallbacteria bacterium]|nr:FAD-dependent oxidoreductase [Candidatus Wallbacteria bacterium]